MDLWYTLYMLIFLIFLNIEYNTRFSLNFRKIMGRLLVVANSTHWNRTYDTWTVAAKEACLLNSLMDVVRELYFSTVELEYI